VVVWMSLLVSTYCCDMVNSVFLGQLKVSLLVKFLLWNFKAYHCVHKRSTYDWLILSQVNPVHTFKTHLSITLSPRRASVAKCQNSNLFFQNPCIYIHHVISSCLMLYNLSNWIVSLNYSCLYPLFLFK
jgi:hypothetical protein